MKNRWLILCLLFSLPCCAANAAPLTVGQPAPPLNFTDLLQAPAGAKADWESLHGKVVVLEFWATWCGGCVEAIPHLNALIQSLPSDKIQFIAVDDEEPAVVKKFVSKVPINGWLGIDTSKKIIDSYQAQVRPTTVVIDPQGKVAAILQPQLLKAEDLLDLAAGKTVAFSRNGNSEIRAEALKAADAAQQASKTADGTALFDLSVRAGEPTGKLMMIHRPATPQKPFKFDILNAPISFLLSYGAGIPQSRLSAPEKSTARYSLHLSAPVGDSDEFSSAIEQAILAASGAKLTRSKKEEDVYVLQALPQAKTILKPSELNMSYASYNPQENKLTLANRSLSELAGQLEIALQVPVVNESGIDDNFDASLTIMSKDAAGATLELEKVLGLTLVKARRDVERFVLELPAVPAPEAKTAASN